MSDRKLKVISPDEAKKRGVMKMTGAGTVMIKGFGKDNALCGNCGAVLIKGTSKLPTFENAALYCNGCGSVNDFPQPPGN